MSGTPDAGLPESPFLATQETAGGAGEAIDSDFRQIQLGMDKTVPKMDSTHTADQNSKTDEEAEEAIQLDQTELTSTASKSTSTADQKSKTDGAGNQTDLINTASKGNGEQIKPSKDWKLNFFSRSQRWSNPVEWNFKILKFGNYFSSDGFKMATKLLGSGESESTKRFEDFISLREFHSGQNQLQMLWIGHATLLVQMGDKNILTDPVFSDVAGPNKLTGYKRYRKPAVTIDELKREGIQIHVVVISHNHYDHLDRDSIKALNASFDQIKWCVPMDLKDTLTHWGCPAENVKEYDWWEEGEVDDLTIRFTPAKHWSGRGTLDWYKTLWGSWIIKTKELTFFFAGDTGYQKELFDAIKQEFPSIDVAAIPIGAYEPREMLRCQHINPEEAVKIHKDLGIKLSVGIHWRTFQLSTETVEQTQEDLAAAIKSQEVDDSTFITLEESLIMRYPREAEGQNQQSIHKPD